ncbi:MAG: radical SAM protein [Desulfobacteraceae bacterium]|nr:radical SAM protein [Desulfobacteraceae bacterium]
MIYLINPFITSKERYGKDIGDIGGHQMPLGIYYLASFLQKKGHSVKILDCEALDITHEKLIDMLSDSQAKIVGITSTTVSFYRARTLAVLIKDRLPHIKIVIGGPHMTAMPLPTMETKAFDFGIVHEGEIAFEKLVSHIVHKKGSLEDIPNLYYLNNDGVVTNPVADFIKDLDSIPFPARDLCDDYYMYKPPVGAFRNQPVMNIITSRGCPYKCIFCDNNTFGRKTRFFSAEYVVDEITQLIEKFGAKEIAFLDDTFILKKDRYYKIFELLNERGLKFSWTCMTRVNNLDYDILKHMAENGCWQVRIGIESGSQKVLDFIKKGITLDQVRNVTQWCKELKIRTSGFFMIGHHIDTPETIQETINFGLSLPLTDIITTINTPIPGTESYQLARQYGTYDEKDWTSLNYWTPVFVPNGLTQEFMMEKQAEFYRRFYMLPRVILQQIGKIRSFSALKMFLYNAYLGLGFLNKKKKTD